MMDSFSEKPIAASAEESAASRESNNLLEQPQAKPEESEAPQERDDSALIEQPEGKSTEDSSASKGDVDAGLVKPEAKLAEGNAPESGEDARYAALRNHRISFAEAIDPNAERVYDLHKMDVVFGRGRGFQNHPGNMRMRDIIEKYKIQYHSLKRAKKRELVNAVYNEIIQDGASRFLKKLDDEEAWVKVDKPVALQKVSHTLRCRKSIEKKIAKEAAESSQMSSNHGLNLGMMDSSSDPLAGLEAQRMAAMNRSRAMATMPGMATNMSGMATNNMMGTNNMSGMAGMVPGGGGGMDYYSMMRREQLIRETMMLRQMGDACLMGPPGVPPGLGMPVSNFDARSMYGQIPDPDALNKREESSA